MIAALARRGAAARVVATFRPLRRFTATGRRRLADFAAARALRRDAALFVGRLAERFGARRFLARFAALTRRLALRLAMALVLSEP
jgi:hypothetical protein